MPYDLGDPAQPSIEIRNPATGVLENAGAVTALVTLPDASTVVPSMLNPSAGLYIATMVTSQVGLHSIRWTATGTNAGVHSDLFDVRDRVGIVSLPDARRHLRLAVDVSRDDELRSVIEAATALLEDHTGRSYRRRTVTETHDGGKHAVVLRRPPVQSVTSVTVGGVATTSYVLDASAGILYHGSTSGTSPWPWGIQNVITIYQAGDPVVSPRAVEGALVTIQHLWDIRRGGSNVPRQTGAQQVPQVALPARALDLLSHDLTPGFA